MPKWTHYLDDDYDDIHPSKEKFKPRPKVMVEDTTNKKEKPVKKEK